MNTHAPRVYEDRKGVTALNHGGNIGSHFVAFEDLVEEDLVVAGCQEGMLPYVRKVYDDELAEAVMGEDVKVNTVVKVFDDLKLRSV